MKGFLKNLVEGSKIAPPEACLQAFGENFADAMNVEWFRKSDHYEAIFYMQQIEHIALFSFNGVLLEYKRNLLPEYLPEPIKQVVRMKGEIMNAVLINKGNMLEYEFILRDRMLKRYLMLLTDMGDVKEVKVL